MMISDSVQKAWDLMLYSPFMWTKLPHQVAMYNREAPKGKA